MTDQGTCRLSSVKNNWGIIHHVLPHRYAEITYMLTTSKMQEMKISTLSLARL